jgi:serine/threonine protein kinase
VELLASYTYKGKYNLVFPQAEDGTLADLFSRDRQTTPFKSNETFFIALARLSSAIEQVHNFVEREIDLSLIGYHHDLRPKNILVSEDTMLLADFGLSRFKASSESSGTVFRQGAGDYLAPECENLNSFEKLVVRRSSDIWSFGCIIAEVATYMILGSNAVKDFQMKRTFTNKPLTRGEWTYSLFHCGPGSPNKAVNDWLVELEKRSPKTCRILLGLVRVMISMDEKKRPKAKEVTARLRFIAQYEVVDTVDELFSSTLKRSDSLGTLIEWKRFEAWKYAARMVGQRNSLDSHDDPNWEWPSAFESTLSNLFQIRDELRSICSQEQSVRPPIFHSLGRLNDRLGELLGRGMQGKSRTYFQESMIASEDELLLEKIRDDDKGLSFDKEIRMRATLKHMTELVMQHYETDACKQQLDLKDVTIGPQFGNHNLGSVQEGDFTHQVLMEWREYGRQCADKTINHELFVRVEAIADLLSQEKPEEFRALDCRGFFHDPNRLAFGVVYDYPQWTWPKQDKLRLKSLQELIAISTRSIDRHPTLDDKFKLAYTLARSVLEFHLVGWLHKGLRPSNIAFFATTEQLQDEWFQEPYVVGFNHSRPDEISAFTGGPEEISAERYQDPTYLEDCRRYCAQFDYYSLGIILLEIGLWRPLDEMIRNYKGSRKDVRDNILKYRVPLLKQVMGRSYFEAVRICVEGDFDQSEFSAGNAVDAKTLHLSFERLVVSQLNKFSI